MNMSEQEQEQEQEQKNARRSRVQAYRYRVKGIACPLRHVVIALRQSQPYLVTSCGRQMCFRRSGRHLLP